MSEFKPFQFTCKYCGNPTTITEPHFHSRVNWIHVQGADYNNLGVRFTGVSCPNPVCNELTFFIELVDCELDYSSDQPYVTRTRKYWSLLPESNAKPQPDYIPKAIKHDYFEACRIRDLSPKSSATLARRCLQGMIRDFWEVSGKRNLKKEIDAIEEKIDPDTWEAIDGIRQMGNIGAHMEQDANLIIDIDPNEAQLLIGLIEILFESWYVSRHDRETRVLRVKAMAAEKFNEKKDGKDKDVGSVDE